MGSEELIKRLEAATGPDRELDGEIALSVGWTYQKMNGDARPYWREPGEERWFVRRPDAPLFTKSLDAIVGLVERELPQANCYGFEKNAYFGVDAFISRNNVPEAHWLVESHGETPPVALCIALLRALAALRQVESGE